ncbi:hypothetical protein DOTSEDRAFT_19831 [Dothistroma septosporum NZE10]|uniref:non-specific serine/threonine protein kinase n=1 Tax=Dothistroma septosporum (strain NZE10 / CBS 128990) TaxID=675120 RepID=N1Q487_DOTSN|nr:hypothetical protein DOTSEDRAFT_19831 [Dothistroma septosporum NZE10]
MRNQHSQRSSVSSHAHSDRQRLVNDQADYEVVKPLRSTTKSRSHEVLYLIEDCDSEELFVQKRLNMTTAASRGRATSERNALWQIMARANASAHVVQRVEAFYDGHDALSYLFLAYCDNGNIEDFIHRYHVAHKSLPEDFAWHVLASLASALCTCHYGINHVAVMDSAPSNWRMLCHLEAKPSNVWLTTQQKVGFFPRVVLIGFDFVSTKDDIATRKAHDSVARFGNWQWMPPEGRLRRDDFGQKDLQLGSATDVWQVGGVIQAMCRLDTVPRMEEVDADQPVCGKDFSSALNNLVACCMQRDWRHRPSAMGLAKEVQREMYRRVQRKARRTEGSGYAVA